MTGLIDPGFVKALQAEDAPALDQPLTPPKKALFPLASPAATAGLPKAEEGPETTDRELVAASFDREAIDRNFWSIRERRVKDKRDALLRDVSQAVFGTDEGYRQSPVSAADMGAPTFGFPAPSTLRDLNTGDVTNAREERASIVAMMDRLTELKADRPGQLANLPATLEELEQLAIEQARGELQGERSEAERAIGNRANDGLIDQGGDLALQFIGGGAAAVSDVEGLALLPLGGGATTLGRAVLIEGALGALAEGVTLPAYNEQAEFLGTEAPNPAIQILFGAAVGAALPIGGRAIRMGANTLTPAGRVRNRDLIRVGLRPNATPRERFASGQLAKGEAITDTAPSVLPLETHQDNLDTASRAIEADQPVIVRPTDIVPDVTRQDQPGTVRQVLDLIRDEEARGSYDTVFDGIRAEDRPPRPITQMTINQVLDWQDSIDARYPSEAVGGYQFLEDTLRDLVKREGLSGNELFDGSMQDRLAITLMRDAGLDAFQRGEISPAEFGNGLAKIWAGLPIIPDTPAGRPDFRGPILDGFRSMDADLEGKIRDIPVSVPYQRTVSAIVRSLGPDLDIRVTSGAQARPGEGPRTGGHRHDVDAHGEGHTADLVLVRNGREVLPGDDPELYARFFEVAAPYFPGMGHYDWGIHVGGGKPAFWGPDTTGATASPVFAEAYNRGRAAGTATGQSYYEGDGLNSALVSVDRFYHVLSVPGAYTAFESGAVHRFPVGQLKVDPETYQYKASDEQGLTDRLQTEREWDPAAAIGVMVHERLDGQMYVADGHQRFGLAKRLTTPDSPIALEGHLYREADGYTPEMMRVKAAIRNIRGETGTPLDAAKIIRDYPEMVAGISRSRGFMLQADGLAQLAPGPYRAIVNEVIPQNYAAVVGRIMPRDEDMQKAAIAAIQRAEPPNVLQAEAIARDIRRLGLERRADAAQGSLFGDEFDLGETAIRERARVLDAVNRELRANKAVFTKLTREGQRIEEAGNVLDQAENLSRQQLAERALQRLFLLSDEPGPVQDAIDAAAKRVRAGDPVASVVDDILDALDADGSPGGRATPATDGAGSIASAADDDLNPADMLPDPDQRAPGQAALFADPVESPADAALLARIEDDVRARLTEEPDLFMAMDAPSTEPTVSREMPVSDLLDDIDGDREFIEQLTLCNPKGA